MNEQIEVTDPIISLSPTRDDLSISNVITKLQAIDTSAYKEVYLQVEEYYDYDTPVQVLNVVGTRTETKNERAKRLKAEVTEALFRVELSLAKLAEYGFKVVPLEECTNICRACRGTGEYHSSYFNSICSFCEGSGKK